MRHDFNLQLPSKRASKHATQHAPSPSINTWTLESRRDAWAILLLSAALLLPAIFNGFPLIFPDSATYLGIAFGSDYAIDRSSFYGLMLKPLANALPGTGGLWLVVVIQALAVATVIVTAARHLSDRAMDRRIFLLLLPALALLTSLPWHAGQIMPDAFTGTLVLLAALAATRDPAADGAPLLWLAAIVMALTHYTHLVLLAAVATSAIAAQILLGLPWRAALKRFAAAVLAVALTSGALVAANGIALQRSTISPTGSVFLFARLHADGLIEPWFDRHCGRDAPAPLCAERHLIPDTSQNFLWGDMGSPTRHVWQPQDDAERWAWVAMMAEANRGAIAEKPFAFLANSAGGALRQLGSFGAIDDECPVACGAVESGGMHYILAKYRPAALDSLKRSMQLRNATPKTVIRAVATPLTGAAMLLLLPTLWLAWRQRDATALAFTAAILAALIVNAALAGALSDVHDRYQSRVAWLAPFLLLFLWLRWRPCPEPSADA